MPDLTTGDVWEEYLKLSRQYHEVSKEVATALSQQSTALKTLEYTTKKYMDRLDAISMHMETLASSLKEVREMQLRSDQLPALISGLIEPAISGPLQPIPAPAPDPPKAPWWQDFRNILIIIFLLVILVQFGFKITSDYVSVEGPGDTHKTDPADPKVDPPKKSP